MTLQAALLGAAAGALGAVEFMRYAVHGRSSQVFAPSVYRGDRTRQALALTFDDGPSESTPVLLDLLAKYHVPATFFMCGANVRRCPAIARLVVAGGHELGNHTDSHARLNFHTPGFIYHEVALAQETIQQITGVTPKLFRAPYGGRWFGLRSAQRRLHLTGVTWTVIGWDWAWPAPRISRRLISGAGNGAILCLHDGRTLQREPDIRATLEAVESVIPALQDRGFYFQTVSQILQRNI